MKRKRLPIIILLIVIIGVAVAVFSITRKNSDNIEDHQPGSIEINTDEHSAEAEPQKSADAVELTAEEWQALILDALDCADMQAETVISSENEMTISGKLPKKTITNWLSNADEDSKGMYQSILSFMPDSLDTSLTCQIDSSDGKVKLSGTSMTVAGIDVPMDVLDGIWPSVNDTLNQSLKEKTDSVSSVRTENGKIILEP